MNYSYNVGARQYTSSKVSLSGNSTEYKKVAKFYPKDSIRTCYVNPEDPSQAVLLPGVNIQAMKNTSALWPLFAGSIVLIIAVSITQLINRGTVVPLKFKLSVMAAFAITIMLHNLCQEHLVDWIPPSSAIDFSRMERAQVNSQARVDLDRSGEL